jgi:hypothetical protein
MSEERSARMVSVTAEDMAKVNFDIAIRHETIPKSTFFLKKAAKNRGVGDVEAKIKLYIHIYR